MPQPQQPPNALNEAINRALFDITGHDPTTEEFGRAVDQISKLHKMKEAERPASVSPDTLIICATNLVGIIAIIKHEQFNVVTSKALGFILKPK